MKKIIEIYDVKTGKPMSVTNERVADILLAKKDYQGNPLFSEKKKVAREIKEDTKNK